eukprot:15002223-Ditylum_brightwellii.AAC.1
MGKFPESLMKRSWEMCCFKSYKTCQTDIEVPMVRRKELMSQSDIVDVVERIAGSDAVQYYFDSENETELQFDEEDNYVV